MDADSVAKAKPEHLVPPIIAKALIEIQRELEPIVRTAENDAYANSYAPLDVVTPAAHRLLAERKIALMQPMVTDESGHAALETILIHESGRSFSRTTKLAMSKVDPQSHGSAVTYTRRYALMAMIGLTSKDEDDDGNKASGAFAPVTKDQIDQIETLLKHMKWPKKSIAAEVFKLKSRDSAALAIMNFEKIVSEMVRDKESKANATQIEVGSADDPVEDVVDESSPHATLQARITKLGLVSKAMENKLVFQLTGRPFLHKVKDEDDLKVLSNALTLLESGVRNLGAEFYPPSSEPRIVEEVTDN